MARFNEQMLPLFCQLQQVGGVQLAPHLLEPDITQYLAEEDRGGGTSLQIFLSFIIENLYEYSLFGYHHYETKFRLVSDSDYQSIFNNVYHHFSIDKPSPTDRFLSDGSARGERSAVGQSRSCGPGRLCPLHSLHQLRQC